MYKKIQHDVEIQYANYFYFMKFHKSNDSYRTTTKSFYPQPVELR